MTVRELLHLCWMSYIDMPPLYVSLLERGGRVPVAAFADTVLRMDAAGALECVKLNAPARKAAEGLRSSEAVIVEYVNNNDSDGFAAYVIENGDGHIIAMRGSERMGGCVQSNVDWTDNICEPFIGSVQLEAIRKLAAMYPEGDLIFTGHSKGGHNALSALTVSTNEKAVAVAFNGQGFGTGTLTYDQKVGLRARAVNYVVDGDIVGVLLEHPERRIYVKGREGVNAHMPEAYIFDDSGAPVRGRRPIRSYAIEAATRFAEKGLKGGARSGVEAICKAALTGYGGWT